MKRLLAGYGPLVVMMVMLATHPSAEAHFGMIIPSRSIVVHKDARSLQLRVSFSHPFEMKGMDMARPMAFGVFANGRKQDLLGGLSPARVMEAAAWQAVYIIERPGACVFYLEPAPYREPAEDIFIIHYTKTVVAVFEDDEGWDAELGLKTEIVPLSRPFGLWTGNVFQGIVKLNGEPVPGAQVEVEFYNQHKSAGAPSELMITQTIKADPNGVFTYAAPLAGWWGFAALQTADFKLSHDGQEKEVELGAVIWVQFHDLR